MASTVKQHLQATRFCFVQIRLIFDNEPTIQSSHSQLKMPKNNHLFKWKYFHQYKASGNVPNV